MRRIAGLALAALVLLALPAAAGAAVTPDRTASDLSAAIASPSAASAAIGAAFAPIAPAGNPAAVADSAISDFPQDGTSFAVLSSGDAVHADPNGTVTTEQNGSTEPADGPRSGVNDLTILRVDLNVPDTVNCALFSFRFLTDEAPGAVFNDGFIAELDTSDWTTAGGVLSAPHNFAFDNNGNVISVNSPGSASLTPAGATGTGFANGTARLTAATPVGAGQHSIYFSVFDYGDDIVDSAVLLDDLRLEQRAAGACTRGAADVVAPVVTVTSPEDGALTRDTTPSISGTAGTQPGDSPNITARIYQGTDALGDPIQTLNTAALGGAWSVTPNALADGTYTVQAAQTDDGGNVGLSSPVTFTVARDATAPTVRITAPTDGSRTDDTTPTISGTAGDAPGDAGVVTVTLRSGSSVVQRLTADRSGTSWSVDSAALQPGDYTAVASQDDDAGNAGTSPAVAFSVTSPPTPTPTPTPTPQQQVDANTTPSPEPVLGQTVVAGAVGGGTVRIKDKNGKFRTLGANESIPLGSTIDATKGRVRLTSAAGSAGQVQTGDFYQGAFVITQTGGSKPITQLALAGALACPAKGKASAAARRKKVRRLWGDGHGLFRTKGRRAAATVRGTKWLTEDRCDSTKITVKRGVVLVRDFMKRKNFVVKKGHSYVARAKKKKKK